MRRLEGARTPSSAGQVESRRGAGGYRLAKPADKTVLLHVYDALEGSPRRDGCLFVRPVCDGDGCILDDRIERARQDVQKALATTTWRKRSCGRGDLERSATSASRRRMGGAARRSASAARTRRRQSCGIISST
jgi:DNA-binding IscR family transcriptional regulator